MYGHGSHLGHVSKTIFTKFTFPLPKRAPHNVWPCGLREKMLENNGHTHVYSPWAGADNPLGLKFFFIKIINLLLIWSFAVFPI